MSTMASQITCLTIVYSIFYSGVNQRKHQSSASLAFVQGIHWWPVNSPHKGPVTPKMFPFDDVIMHRDKLEKAKWKWESHCRWKHERQSNCFQCLHWWKGKHNEDIYIFSEHRVCSKNYIHGLFYMILPAIPLKWKCHHFEEIFITGCTWSCHFDNFRRSQWWKFHQTDTISISMTDIMITSWNENTFQISGLLCRNPLVTGEFTAQRPAIHIYDNALVVVLIKSLDKQSSGQWNALLQCPCDIPNFLHAKPWIPGGEQSIFTVVIH